MVWTRVLREEENSPLTLREAAGLLRIDPATANRMFASGRLKARKRSGVYVLRFRDVVREARERGIELGLRKGPFLRG